MQQFQKPKLPKTRRKGVFFSAHVRFVTLMLLVSREEVIEGISSGSLALKATGFWKSWMEVHSLGSVRKNLLQEVPFPSTLC